MLTPLLGAAGHSTAKLFLEFIDSAGGIDQFLPACKKRMAGRTNVDGNIRFGTPGFDYISTSAPNDGGPIMRVNVFFHQLLAPYFSALLRLIKNSALDLVFAS